MPQNPSPNAWVHERLTAWGSWARDGALRALPAVTPIGRLMTYGAHGAAVRSAGGPTQASEQIAQTDAAVSRLATPYRRPVVAYYTHWEPVEACARRCRLSVRTMYRVLARARSQLAVSLAS